MADNRYFNTVPLENGRNAERKIRQIKNIIIKKQCRIEILESEISAIKMAAANNFERIKDNG